MANASCKLSSAGGQIADDMTDGFGPKEYALHRAPAGAYRVRINGYDADRINPNAPGHVLIHLQRNFGRPREAQELVDLDLSFQTGRNRDDEDETRPVATLCVSRQSACPNSHASPKPAMHLTVLSKFGRSVSPERSARPDVQVEMLTINLTASLETFSAF